MPGSSREQIMRTMVWVIVLLCIACASFGADVPAESKTTFTAEVAAQARINVDDQGAILSIFNTTDGSGNRPAVLNVYRGEAQIPITPEIQASLDKLSPDWKQGGLIYSQQPAPDPTPPSSEHPRI